MVRPTLAEIRYFQVNGKQPASLVERRKAAEKEAKEAAKKAESETETSDEETPEETPTDEDIETEEEVDETEWPQNSGGGWWVLSDGRKFQNEEKAREEQSTIDVLE